MKTTTTLAAIFCLLSFAVFSQHMHQTDHAHNTHNQIEELFTDKSLQDFENLIDLDPSDLANDSLMNYIDQNYLTCNAA